MEDSYTSAETSPRRRSNGISPVIEGGHRMLGNEAARLVALSLILFASTNYAQTPTTSTAAPQASEDRSIRPFKVQVPQAALDDLRRRIAATRWPDKETAGDQSQGAQLAKLQELVRYWGTDYDWRKVEAKLNALPQFVTTIDGVDIHFIH